MDHNTDAAEARHDQSATTRPASVRLLLGTAATAGPLAVFEIFTGVSVAGRAAVPGFLGLYLVVAAVGMVLIVRQVQAGEDRQIPSSLRAWVGWALLVLPIAAFAIRLGQGLGLSRTPSVLGLPLLYAFPVAVGMWILASRRRELRA